MSHSSAPVKNLSLMRVRRLVAYEDNLCVFKGDIGWWTVGSAPALGEPVTFVQGDQRRIGAAATDCQIAAADRGARQRRGAWAIAGDLFCCWLACSHPTGPASRPLALAVHL